jgi:hypothetical protein
MLPVSRLIRVLPLVGLCLLLLAPRAEAGRRRVCADFDADGHRDRVTLDAHEPWIVRIWLSATRSTHIIRSAQPLRDITAVDLNGDRRPELIASTRARGLQVWAKAPDGFVVYPHRARPPTRQASGAARHRLDDNNEESPPEIANAKQIHAFVVTSFHRQAAIASVGSRADQPRGRRTPLQLAPLSPRPPPTIS